MGKVFVIQFFAPVILFSLCFVIKNGAFRIGVLLSFIITIFVSIITLGSYGGFSGWGIIFGVLLFNFSYTQIFYFVIFFSLLSFFQARKSILTSVYLFPPLFLITLFVINYQKIATDIETKQAELYSEEKAELDKIPEYVVTTGSTAIKRREFFFIEEIKHLIEIKKDGRYFLYDLLEGNKVSEFSVVDTLPDNYLFIKTGKNTSFASDYRDKNGQLIARNLYAYEIRHVDGASNQLIDVDVKTDWFKPIIPPSISNRFSFVRVGSTMKRGSRSAALRALMKRVYEQGT